MNARLAAGLFVSALIRRIEIGGGSGTVLAKGDATSGAILIVIANRGSFEALLERALDKDGQYRWTNTGPNRPDDPMALSDYIARRRRTDPDLWVVELDGREARAIVNEIAGED